MQDIVGLAAPASLLLLFLFQVHKSSILVRPPREVLLASALLVFLVANIVFNRSLVGISLVGFIRDQGRMLYMLALFAVFFLRDPRDRLERVLYPSAFYFTLVISLISLFSYFVSTVSIGGVKFSGETRLLGALGGHNPTAGSHGAILILFLIAAMQRRDALSPMRMRAILWVAASVIFLAILMTKSRGYILALFVAFTIMYMPRLWSNVRRLRISWHTIVAGVLLLAALATAGLSLRSRISTNVLADRTVAMRLALFARAWSLGARSPLFGLGLGTFEQRNLVIRDVVPGLVAYKEAGDYLDEKIPMTVEGGLHAHNIVLQLFAEIGLVGIALLTALLASTVFRRRRLSTVVPHSDKQAEVLAAARFNGQVVVHLLAYLVTAGIFAGYTLVSPSTSWLLYVAMARLIRQERYLQSHRRGGVALLEAGPSSNIVTQAGVP